MWKCSWECIDQKQDKINSGVADLDGRTKRKQIRVAENAF